MLISHRYFQFLCLLLSLFCVSTQADPRKQIRLMNLDGTQVANYEQLVENLAPGTEVLMADKNFVVIGFLGTGGSEVIYEIEGDKALRLTKYLNRGKWSSRYLEGYTALKQGGVAIPESFVGDSHINRYVVVQKIDVKFNLNELFENKVTLDEAKREFIWKEFVIFAKSTARFSKIDDFKPLNIVWDGKKWVLLDWDHRHIQVHSVNDPNVFSQWYYKIPPDIYRQSEAAINNARKQFPPAVWDSCRAAVSLLK